MTAEQMIAEYGVYAGTVVVCFVGGLAPFINTEAWLLFVTLTAREPSGLPLVVALAAVSAMAAKTVLYASGRGAGELSSRRFAAVTRARERIARWRDRPVLLILVSATTGLPPLYAVSLLAGALAIRLRAFVLVGLLGRTLRFALIVAVAWAMR